jgi:dihydroflavonol-4-reductase
MLDKNSRILLTGATGFLGRYILRSLISAGYNNLVCLTRKNIIPLQGNFEDASVNWIYGDISDILFLEQALDGFDGIIHCAAIVSFDIRQKKSLLKTSMEGTANLVNIALEKKVTFFLHISSVAALGRKKPEESISEKSVFSHSTYDTTYGLSKFLAEQEVWRGHAEGLKVAILNPSTILGSGNWHQSSPQIFRKIHSGLPFYPTGSTGWVDVRDVASAVLKILDLQPNGERFIISSQNMDYKQVFEKIASCMNVKPPRYPLQTRFGAWKWRLESLKAILFSSESQLTRETYQSTSAISNYQNNKSTSTLGLLYIPIEQTIAQTCAVFLESYPSGRAVKLLP